MQYTADPLADYECFSREMEERLAKMPECNYCGYKAPFVWVLPMGAHTVKCCPACLDNRFMRTVCEDDGEVVCEQCGRKVKYDETYHLIAGEAWCDKCIELLEKEE